MLKTTKNAGLAMARFLRVLANEARLKRNVDFLSKSRYIVRGMLKSVEVCSDGLALILTCGSRVIWRLDSIVANAAKVCFSVLTIQRTVAYAHFCSFDEAYQVLQIRQHDCIRSGCGVVCTFGEW